MIGVSQAIQCIGIIFHTSHYTLLLKQGNNYENILCFHIQSFAFLVYFNSQGKSFLQEYHLACKGLGILLGDTRYSAQWFCTYFQSRQPSRKSYCLHFPHGYAEAQSSLSTSPRTEKPGSGEGGSFQTPRTFLPQKINEIKVPKYDDYPDFKF